MIKMETNALKIGKITLFKASFCLPQVWSIVLAKFTKETLALVRLITFIQEKTYSCFLMYFTQL